MKNILYTLMAIIILQINAISIANAQQYQPMAVDGAQRVQLLTIGEVFNFEVGDEFHYKIGPAGLPPNGDRVTITNKFLSSDLNSVTYFRQHNYYSSSVDWSTYPPTMVYNFSNFYDTVTFSNLDQPITTYDNDLLTEWFISNHCDSLTNGCDLNIGPAGFDNDNLKKEYGKGLGLIEHTLYAAQSQSFVIYNKLVFYRRGNNACGTADITKVTTEPISQVSVYPNPASNYLTISTDEQNITFRIYSLTGKVMQEGDLVKGLNTVNIETLTSGIYIVNVISNQSVSSIKFIKE